MIKRPGTIERIDAAFAVHPAVALVGPRQCGKTTLARMYASKEGDATFFDLERTMDQRRLEAPEQALTPLRGLVVIDEVQRAPSLFEALRVLLDRPGADARFLLLGSASPRLLRNTSETLAGRVGIVDLAGFDMTETPSQDWRTLWERGGFPRSYLARSASASALWRENFIRTFLERDIPQLGIGVPAESLRRFWTMIAHYHGQIWNASEFARAMGTSEGTARRYLDILQGAYMVRALTPWHENIKKRQVKSPKIYVRDSGLLHALLELASFGAIAGHPKIGASFEGFAIEQFLSCFNTRSASFWATHGGAELDLLVNCAGRRYGFQCKYGDAPGATRAMHSAVESLGLERLWVVYPGDEPYALTERISVLPVGSVPAHVRRMRNMAPSRSPGS